MDRLAILREAGVSIWLDTLSRDLLEEGKFEELINTFRVTGATSNPTIFAEAITSSDRYDAQLAHLLDSGVSDPSELFLALALEDVRAAADMLADTFAKTRGREGYVSFECTPDVAHDTQATVEQAMELWKRLDRKNVMIKVPATDAGMGAITELTAAGVNVNVTLLFSLSRYDQTVQAYFAGLRQRHRKPGAEPVMSVASFFVSRVDKKADAILGEGSDLRGRVAIANARRAYAHYINAFMGNEWHRLSARGARPQRCLWASTTPKNPEYSDLLYVERLAGRNVVSTMTEETIRAAADHADIVDLMSTDTSESDRVVAEAEAHGVDLEKIGAELEAEGIAAFEESYKRILDCVQKRVQKVQSQPAGASSQS